MILSDKKNISGQLTTQQRPSGVTNSLHYVLSDLEAGPEAEKAGPVHVDIVVKAI